MDHITGLQCLICGKRYRTDEIDYVCPDHGDEGILNPEYDYERIAHRFKRDDLSASTDTGMWRYKPLLPVDPDAEVPPVRVGWTPLYPSPHLARQLGLKQVFVKDDGCQPTGSLKDRASSLAVVKAREKKAAIIVTASTGNAGAALSGMCASMGQPNLIFVPETAPKAKIAQLLVFGSRVLLVKGSYDDAYDLCQAAAKTYGWYNRNTGYNPYMSEGKKTAAFEICEQMGWEPPDSILVSVGDGCIIGGLHKGLKDLYAMGWIERIPRLIGVQAEGSDYLFQAWKNGEDVLTKSPIEARTVADSICAGLPRDRLKAMAAVNKTQGAFIRVSDEMIVAAISDLARITGVFAEPAGATPYAGLVTAIEQGLVAGDETAVILVTGNGLKDISTAMKSTQSNGLLPFPVKPELDDLKRIISEMKTPVFQTV